MLRFYSTHKDPKQALRASLGLCLPASIVPFAAAGAACLMGYSTAIGIPLFPHLLLLSFSLPSLCVIAVCASVARSIDATIHFAIFRLGYTAIKSLAVFALLSNSSNSHTYATAVAISGTLMLFYATPFVAKHASATLNYRITRSLAAFGFPFVLHVVGGSLLGHYGRFFLLYFGTPQDIASFTYASTLAASIFFGYTAIATYFEPVIYKSTTSLDACERSLSNFTFIALATGALLSAALLLLLPHLLGYVHSDFRGAFAVMPAVIAAALLQPLYLQGNYRLACHKKTFHIATGTILGGALNVGCNFLLTPKYGATGAGISLYIGTMVQTLYTLVVSLRIGNATWGSPGLRPSLVLCSITSLSVLVGHSLLSGLVLLASSAISLSLFWQQVARCGRTDSSKQ
jgi:O-antigen/teichoic acid export membrane protein